MARCAFHPDVETNLRCAECARYICPRDMVETPVGHKCRECARPARSQLAYVKPRQWAGAVGAGVAAGVLGGLLLGQASFGFFFVMLLYGALVGEAVRRGSGGHRGGGVAAVAAACVVIGAFVGGLSLFQAAFAILGAVGSSARA